MGPSALASCELSGVAPIRLRGGTEDRVGRETVDGPSFTGAVVGGVFVIAPAICGAAAMSTSVQTPEWAGDGGGDGDGGGGNGDGAGAGEEGIVDPAATCGSTGATATVDEMDGGRAAATGD